MEDTEASICVLGAGVIGLSSALRLQQAFPRARVTIVAEKFSPNTTGDGSGGFWEPHVLKNTSIDKQRRWSQDTFEYIANLLGTEHAGEAGLNYISGYSLFTTPEQEPFWKDIVYGFRHLSKEELKRYPGHSHGWFHTTWVIQCAKYLPWMMTKYRDNGGRVIKQKITDLKQLCGQYDVIVNCCGLGAYELLDDKALVPVRGQVIRVAAPWVKHFVLSIRPPDISYILASGDHVVVGGTHDEGEWDTTVDHNIKQQIWTNACKVVPSLKHGRILQDWVGLRPSRDEVRLELEMMDNGHGVTPVIHNYGHGGAGVTLHWGCAEDAVSLVRQAVQGLSHSKHAAKL